MSAATVRWIVLAAWLCTSGTALAQNYDVTCPTLKPGEVLLSQKSSWNGDGAYVHNNWVWYGTDKWKVPAGFRWTGGDTFWAPNFVMQQQYFLRCSSPGGPAIMQSQYNTSLGFNSARQMLTSARDLAATVQDGAGNPLPAGFFQVGDGPQLAITNGVVANVAALRGGAVDVTITSADRKSSVNTSVALTGVGPGGTLKHTFKQVLPWILVSRTCRFRVSNDSTHHVSYDFQDPAGKNSCEATCSNDRGRDIAKDLLGWSKGDVHVNDVSCSAGTTCGGKTSCRS